MLEHAIVEANTAEAQLRARLAGLVDHRNDLLIDGSDDEVDAAEAELDAITRQLDRLELRLPLLRTRHAEQLAAEQRAVDLSGLEAAIQARVDTAEAVERALAELGVAFRDFRKAGRRLDGFRRLGGRMSLSTEGRELGLILQARAPEFREAVGARYELFPEERSSLAGIEAEYWARVLRAARADDGPSTAGRTADDRTPSVQPVTADDLERSGRYGRGGTAKARLGDGWSDTDGDGEQEAGDAVAA